MHLKIKIKATREDVYAVTGYFGEFIVGLRNPGTKDVVFYFGISENVERLVHLPPGVVYDIRIDAVQCIKRRFMPYIKTAENSGSITVEIIWDSKSVSGISASSADVSGVRVCP